MKNWIIFFSAIVISSLSTSTLVLAADEVREVGYEELVQQLAQKKSRLVRNSNDPLDSLKIHAGLGILSSMTTVSTGSPKDGTKYQNGFQLSLGIDLFSPVWAAEAALRNFGQSKSLSETKSLREFDLKFMNKNYISANTGYRIGAGIGTRYLRVTDVDTDIDENTPTAILFAGFDIFASQNVSVGVEGGYRSSMVNRTADKGGMDLSLRLDTYF